MSGAALAFVSGEVGPRATVTGDLSAAAPTAAPSDPGATTGSSADGAVASAAAQDEATPTAAPSPSETAAPEPAPSPTPDPEDGAAGIYAYTLEGMLDPAVADMPERIYVPNGKSDTVDIIDPNTFEIVEHYSVEQIPQHVVPSWDMQTLWVTNNAGNSMNPIDPRTGEMGSTIRVDAPYNLYFTMDGSSAIVVAERRQRLDFRDPQTMELQESVPVDCKGIDHLDFSADGSHLVASCEFASKMIKFDLATRQVVGEFTIPGNAKPQDVRLLADGQRFLVADLNLDGVFVVHGDSFEMGQFIPTGAGAHGIYPSRDGLSVYVSNRAAGTVSVMDMTTLEITDTWSIPGGSPDMGGVSADGSTLWLAGRYSTEIYAFDTTTGEVKARVQVGSGPHGLAVFPQPGRYSLGHTGSLR